MWLKLFVIVAVLSAGLRFGETKFANKTHQLKDQMANCSYLNSQFYEANNEFLTCLSKNTEEATFCIYCAPNYAKTLQKFNDLMTGNETITANNNNVISCRSRFVDSNQLDLVEIIFATTKRLWDVGSCSDCFQPKCNFLNYNDDKNCVETNETAEFTDLYEHVTDCINNPKFTGLHDAKMVCKTCSDAYNNMTNMYNLIRRKTVDKFCYVIKYYMNTTRNQWTNDKCNEDRTSSDDEFYMVSSFSVTMSICFYILTYIVGIRKERIQEIPNDLMPPVDMNESNRTIMNIQAEGPSTSNLLGPILRIITNDSSSSVDDNDEEILSIDDKILSFDNNDVLPILDETRSVDDDILPIYIEIANLINID